MYIRRGEEIKISSSSLPYARYFSFQSYSIPDFVSSASLRDVDIIPSGNGPNCYTNLTAAMAGAKQGGYEVVVTSHGDHGHANELRALADDRASGYFILFFRIYQDRVGSLPPMSELADDMGECFGPRGRYPTETPQEWGWACPPSVAVKRLSRRVGGGKFETLPLCGYRRKHGIVYNDVTPPVIACPSVRAPNLPFNFFLPSPDYIKQKFANKDAKYLFSCAEAPWVPEKSKGAGGWSFWKGQRSPVEEGREREVNREGATKKENHRKPVARDKPSEDGEVEGEGQRRAPEAGRGSGEGCELWARVTGRLPRTANSLYEPPFIANFSDYDVRYVSLSSVGRSLPYRGYQTLHDADITEHYLREFGPAWLEDRSFKLWLGPPQYSLAARSHLPGIVREEKGLFLPWGRDFRGEHIPFPGILYRQILSQGQVVGPSTAAGNAGPGNGSDCAWTGERKEGHRGPPAKSLTGVGAASATGSGAPIAGLAEIIPPTCEKQEGEGTEPLHVLSNHLCCGPAAPEWCHDPRFVASKMRDFYPLVEYYLRRPPRDTRDGLEAGGRDENGEALEIVDEEDEVEMERIGGGSEGARKMTLYDGQELGGLPPCMTRGKCPHASGEGAKDSSQSWVDAVNSLFSIVGEMWTEMSP